MPARALLGNGTATASLQGILRLDFLVPSALGRRCLRSHGSYARVERGLEGRQDDEEGGSAAKQLWAREDRTGEAVGEGSSRAVDTVSDGSSGGGVSTGKAGSEENARRTMRAKSGAVWRERNGLRETISTSTPRKLAKAQVDAPDTRHEQVRAAAKKPPYRSVSHRMLDRPDPLPASMIKDYLRLRPSLVSATSLNPLIHHAQRTSNKLVERHARRARDTVDERYWRAQEDPDPPDETVDLAGQTVASHPWAKELCPPRRYGQPLDVFQSLGKLHHRLLCASPSSPPPAPNEAVDTIRRYCDAEGRGTDGTIEALSNVMHLYVIYAEKLFLDMDGYKVIGEFADLCPELRPTKQTLHLLVTQLLWPTILHLDQEVVVAKAANDPALEPLRPPRPRPSDDPETVQRILDVLSHFALIYDVSPGTETLRQIGIYASTTDDPALARVAFDGWYTAHERGVRRTPGEGDTARYAHRGTSWTRWRSLVRTWKRRGWVEQVEVAGGSGASRDKGDYVWVEGVGEPMEESRGDGPTWNDGIYDVDQEKGDETNTEKVSAAARA